ncbi:MAG: alpha-galactosidase [Terriglobia bacterium]
MRSRLGFTATDSLSRVSLFLLVGGVLAMLGCDRSPAPPGEQALPSAVAVTVNPGGPVVLKTHTAEFEILPSGYLQAYLIKDGKRLTLDEPESGGAPAGGYLVSSGKEVRDFALDFEHAKVSDTRGKLGARGKRVEITGRSTAEEAAGIEKTLAVEVYDDFPNLALSTVAYRNAGSTEFALDQVVEQRHRLNASLADPKAPPYRLWSFQGSSYDWGKDDVINLSKNFSQPNLMGAMNPNGLGGGIPVVAFWTATVGEAIGHVETLPLVLSLPVKVGPDERIQASLVLDSKTTLKPGEVFSTPRSFVAVFAGDFYEPLHLYSSVLQREGWTIPKPTNEDYNMSWCGWGYEFDVTPAQMLGTVPKLKELGIKWATLDDRWFDNYGDWEPRPDTFPGDAIKKMVDDFHKQGILAQIWWLPIGVEDGQGKYESHPYRTAKVVADHPDWLILDKNGKHARMARGLAALCPALREVQEFHKQLTERFIRDWGFDGHKLDNIFTVPACYNPKHQHKSPDESIRAMGEVYRAIFQTTRQLKPESVTQSCPCGTPPNLAWLPFMDQAVTADPVGAVQVRRRIKMYKALLGPQAAVYGDHVELSEMPRTGQGYAEVGKDFASTIGTGGVVGTKFTWPDYGPKFKNVFLTPEKEALWKKWTAIYNSKMLSRGTFLDLYTLGYDVPEGYVIERDGKMYYAFFAPLPATSWQGTVELRGLRPGKYRVFDYENGKDLGVIDSGNPKLATEFAHHLLLEVTKL